MLREPTTEEWEDYFVNERINDRGVKIDKTLAAGAQVYAAEEQAELVGQIRELTGVPDMKARGERIKAWIMERLDEDQLALMVKYDKGVKKYSLDKYIREQLLAQELDPVVADVIQCSDFAQKSSVSKFKTMLLRADPQTDRVCGAFMANGAAGTGRYSSRGVQLHNFTRKPLELRDEAIADIKDNIMPEDIRDYFKLPIMEILSRLLRPALVPAKGNVFVVADWSAVEGCVAPWLTMDNSAEKKLKQYRDKEPVYEITAAATFHVPVEEITKDDPRRQIGKVQELAFQFGGGSNAFLGMARNYGVKATKAEAEKYKVAWRKANPWAEKMWKRLEAAAFIAIRAPGKVIPVGRVNYFAVEKLFGYDLSLICELPCGRFLTYPDIRVKDKKTPWGEMRPAMSYMRAGWTPKQGEKAWPRGGLYGGLAFENIVQGTAASLLRGALRACDEADLPVVMHVHDEPVAEVLKTEQKLASGYLHKIMHAVPAWAEGLPLSADVKIMTRYGK